MIIKNLNGELLDIAWPRENGTYDLSESNLRDANLTLADLRDANLSLADLRGANLTGFAIIDAGQDWRGYRFIARQGNPMMVAAGCRWLTAADAREHWANNPECLGKVEMIIAEAGRFKGRMKDERSQIFKRARWWQVVQRSISKADIPRCIRDRS